MELRQIKYFLEVAKREHVTEAADILHVAQSAVSRQISNLEGELGVRLFVREGRNVKLTPVGQIFREHAEFALNEIENAKDKVNEFLNPESGVIRIGFQNSLATNTLPAVISSFRQKYPNVSFRVQQGTLKYLIQSVLKGGVDLAFTAPVPRDEKNVKGRIFFTEKMVVLVPVQHPLSEQTTIRLNQLSNDPFVLFRTGLRHNIVLDACQQAGFDPKIAFEGEDIDTIKGLVAAGLGVGLLPETTLAYSIPRDTKKINISEPEVTRTVGVITPKNRELAPSEKLFFDFLRDFYSVLNRFGQ